MIVKVERIHRDGSEVVTVEESVDIEGSVGSAWVYGDWQLKMVTGEMIEQDTCRVGQWTGLGGEIRKWKAMR